MKKNKSTKKYYGGMRRDPLSADETAEFLRTSTTCLICKKPMTMSDYIWETDCKHYFHWDCLLRTCDKHPECPACKSELICHVIKQQGE